MRIRALLVAVLLGGCASGVGPSAGLPSVRPGPPPGRARPVHPGDATTALLRAGTADAINVAEARAMLGPPDVERHDGVGALLVWTGPTCALALGFAGDRLRTAEPGPRRTGDPPPGIQACLAEIRARRTTQP